MYCKSVHVFIPATRDKVNPVPEERVPVPESIARVTETVEFASIFPLASVAFTVDEKFELGAIEPGTLLKRSSVAITSILFFVPSEFIVKEASCELVAELSVVVLVLTILN